MILRHCRVCGEKKIDFDMRRSKAFPELWECRDDCFASYDKHVGIKLVAPNATEEQKAQVIASALDLCKSFGPAQEAAKSLRHMSFKVDPKNLDVLVEDDLPSIGLGVPDVMKMEIPSPPTGTVEAAAHMFNSHDFLKLAQRIEAEGFDGPEDGVEDRYHERRAKQTPLRHRFWWFVHNAVAHPLIAFVPRKPFFRFHDWTSRKLHGR